MAILHLRLSQIGIGILPSAEYYVVCVLCSKVVMAMSRIVLHLPGVTYRLIMRTRDNSLTSV